MFGRPLFEPSLDGFLTESRYMNPRGRRKRRMQKQDEGEPSPFQTSMNSTSGSTSPELIMATQTIETGCDRKTHRQFSRRMACYCGISLKVFKDFRFLDQDTGAFFVKNARAEQRNFYMFADPRYCQLPLPPVEESTPRRKMSSSETEDERGKSGPPRKNTTSEEKIDSRRELSSSQQKQGQSSSSFHTTGMVRRLF